MFTGIPFGIGQIDDKTRGFSEFSFEHHLTYLIQIFTLTDRFQRLMQWQIKQCVIEHNRLPVRISLYHYAHRSVSRNERLLPLRRRPGAVKSSFRDFRHIYAFNSATYQKSRKHSCNEKFFHDIVFNGSIVAKKNIFPILSV